MTKMSSTLTGRRMVFWVGVAMVMSTLLFSQGSEAEVVSIDSEAFYIVRRHNQLRKSTREMASNMMEMQWDKNLAWRASIWSDRCEYRRPTNVEHEDIVNANLFLSPNYVYGNKTIHKMVETALDVWARSKADYRYDTHCGRSCSYVQMIMAQADQIGCSLSYCEKARAGSYEVNHASLFVCYYKPGLSLVRNFPYSRGQKCSRCPRDADCRDGLCHRPGTEIVPRDLMPQNFQTRPQAIVEYRDELTRDEKTALTNSHNRMRQGNGVNRSLRWDPFLERWASWIVHCTVDYPGPRHTYTNFERLDPGANVYDVVSTWSKEGSNTHLRMEHGCRTPVDGGSCNHFTNVLEGSLTSMACGARDCGNGRQLICIYDDRNVRPGRRRPSSSRRQPTRSNTPQRYQARRQNVRQPQTYRETRRQYEERRREEQMRRQKEREAQKRREQQRRGYYDRRRGQYESERRI